MPDNPDTRDDLLKTFAPRLPDDTVEYEIRLLDDKLAERDIRQELRKIQTASTALIKKHLKGYIWQREGFAIEVVKDGAPLLRGRTNFGDSVEDEWLIVYLLRELSRQFNDAWVRVVDGDGEFLLSEAANVLPKWVNPDVAEHRVWLNRGDLLLIPPAPIRGGPKAREQQEKQPATFISLPQALVVLRRPRNEMLHSPLIQEEAFYRLRHYPSQIQQNFHHALTRIPRRLAMILHELPASVAPAVEAFYLRSPVALRPLKENLKADLTFPPEDFVTARVKFPKVGYAQVCTQRFTAVGEWARLDSVAIGQTAEEEKRAEIGMKLACGFEMLMADPQHQDRQAVREVKILLDDLEQGAENLPSDKEIQTWGTEEDDDSWMDIDFEEFEAELAGRGGPKSTGNGSRKGFGDKTAQEDLQKLVSRFEDFLNDDALADDDEDNDEDDSEDEELEAGEDKATSFEEDEFTALMREMMGLPPEAMRELMGPQAGKATGLAGADHPDFTEGGDDLEKRMAKLFSALDAEPTGTTKGIGGEGSKNDSGNTQAKGKAKVSTKYEPKLFGDLEDYEDLEDDEAIRELAAQMEAELKRAGGLSLSDPSLKALKSGGSARSTSVPQKGDNEGDESDDGDLLDEDFNLVANMLRSFESQAGGAGPAGNVLGMMGVRLPRNDDSEDEGSSVPGSSSQKPAKGRIEELE